MLHGLCCGEEAGARNLVFFRVKWLQATMKGIPRLCGGCGWGRFVRESFLQCVLPRTGWSCVRSSMRFLKFVFADRIEMAA